VPDAYAALQPLDCAAGLSSCPWMHAAASAFQKLQDSIVLPYALQYSMYNKLLC
jgi:hypothetical protein